jgi:hypothetical protein
LRRHHGEDETVDFSEGVKFENGIEAIKNAGSPRRLTDLVTHSPA